MGTGALLLVGLTMAVGIIGVLVPLLPGLLLVGAAALVWAMAVGSTTGWVVFAAIVVVLGLGTTAKYVLPARDLAAVGAPRSTLLIGAVGAVVGFFVIPVVGLPIGGVLAVYLAELRRLHGDGAGARRSTVVTIRAIGIGILIELAAGVLATLIWLAGVLAT